MRPSGNVSLIVQMLNSVWRAIETSLTFVCRAAAVIVLALYMPVFIFVGCLVALTPGPTCVAKPYRRSKSSGIVHLWEFRTECSETYRETPVGRLLRATGVHKLPRILNVALGHVDMGEDLQPVNT